MIEAESFDKSKEEKVARVVLGVFYRRIVENPQIDIHEEIGRYRGLLNGSVASSWVTADLVGKSIKELVAFGLVDEVYLEFVNPHQPKSYNDILDILKDSEVDQGILRENIRDGLSTLKDMSPEEEQDLLEGIIVSGGVDTPEGFVVGVD